MKKKNRFKPQKTGFAITGYILMWALMMAVAIVFTQALRNSVSYVFIIIVSVLPVLDLAYVFAARASVRTAFSCSTAQAQKNEPVTVELSVKNRSLLPVPFTEVELILPDEEGLHSVSAAVSASLSPLGSYVYGKNVLFPYKGEYSCGIKNVYVGSLFRFFRFKIKTDKCKSVLILPERITLDDMPTRYVNETSAVTGTPIKGPDSAEITEIKEYVPGDPIRNIHWKLSTKVEELMTKHFGAENGLMTCVIADSGAHYELDSGMDIDINEFCDDAVCEICCYVVSAALLEGRKAALVYNDSHRNRTTTERKLFDGISGFEDFLPYYAACSPVKPVSASALLGYCEDGVDNDIIFVTSRLTEDTVTALCEAQTVNRSVTLLLFEPYSKINDPTQLRSTAEAGIRELAAADVIVQKINEKELV